MTQRLSPEMLAAGYDFLRQTKPFKGMRLPHSSKVKFKVVRDPAIQADFGMDGPGPIIRVSEAHHGFPDRVLPTTAHEMLHLYQALNGLETKAQHNADYRRRSITVCRLHGWDIKTFV